MSRARCDMLALRTMIQEGGVGFRTSSISWIFDCPRCSKKNRLHIRKTDGRTICFYCASNDNHYNGRPDYAVHDLFDIPLSLIRLRLYGGGDPTPVQEQVLEIPEFSDFYDRAAGDVDPLEEWEEEVVPLTMPYDFISIDDEAAEKGRQYLGERGISMEIARRYDIRYHPQDQRVIFPVQRGVDILGWQARMIGPSEWRDENGVKQKGLKILSPPSFDKSLTLMFGDQLNGSDHIVLTEGPVDAIKCCLCGGAVATMGKHVSWSQIRLIRKSGVKKIYLGLDPDAGLEANRLAKQFSDLEVYRLLPTGKAEDLGDMAPEEVLKAFQTAPRFDGSEFFLTPFDDFWTRTNRSAS